MTELGWRPQIPLADGIARTYEWFLQNVAETRAYADA
jgi:nucleoside-diphosphate-sugar epimerase